MRFWSARPSSEVPNFGAFLRSSSQFLGLEGSLPVTASPLAPSLGGRPLPAKATTEAPRATGTAVRRATLARKAGAISCGLRVVRSLFPARFLLHLLPTFLIVCLISCKVPDAV